MISGPFLDGIRSLGVGPTPSQAAAHHANHKMVAQEQTARQARANSRRPETGSRTSDSGALPASLKGDRQFSGYLPKSYRSSRPSDRRFSSETTTAAHASVRLYAPQCDPDKRRILGRPSGQTREEKGSSGCHDR